MNPFMIIHHCLPLENKHNSYIPTTLNSYNTHPIWAGPRGLGAPLGVLLDWGMSQLLGLAAFSGRTAGHSYCQKSKMVTMIISLTKKNNIYRFTHYFHFPHPVLFVVTCPHYLLPQEGTSSSSP